MSRNRCPSFRRLGKDLGKENLFKAALSGFFFTQVPSPTLRRINLKSLVSKDFMAEKEGFEPPVELPPQLISSHKQGFAGRSKSLT